IEGKTIRIAEAAREDAMSARLRIKFPNRRTSCLGLGAAFECVAVPRDADVKLRSVWARRQVLGPMVVDEPRGQIDHLLPPLRDLRLTRRERIAHQLVGLGDVQIIADEDDAKRRIELVEKDALELGHAIAVGVTKQCDPVGRAVVAAAVRQTEDEVEERVLYTLDRFLALFESLDDQ